jgi:hypothetical protein
MLAYDGSQMASGRIQARETLGYGHSDSCLKCHVVYQAGRLHTSQKAQEQSAQLTSGLKNRTSARNECRKIPAPLPRKSAVEEGLLPLGNGLAHAF